MFAVVAAILFGLELIFEVAKTHLSGITLDMLNTAGLLFLALHFASTHGWSRRSYRR